MTEQKKIRLTPAQEKFIVHWGEMGTRWGINRTMAQIHALLYLMPRPLPAEEIAETLSVARSNVSTSLRELQGWGLVKVTHVLGDRRDHFESLKDVWQMFRVVMEGRKRREMDPTVEMLRQAMIEVDPADRYTRERLQAMLDFFETALGAYGNVNQLPIGAIRKLAKAGGALGKLLGGGR